MGVKYKKVIDKIKNQNLRKQIRVNKRKIQCLLQ